MRILIVNPNTTSSMTAKIAAAARLVSRRETEILAINPSSGPASIQGFYDAALCVPEMLKAIAAHSDYDAIVIACFDDTGLDAVRSLVSVPVIGIGEAAFHAASFLSCRFSVITTLRRSLPGIEANLLRYGFSGRCARVRATEIAVLELERGDRAMVERISDEVACALKEDGAEAIVLGCSGMADLVLELSRKFEVPIIDGVSCATTFAEALVAVGARTSKLGGYATPMDAGSAVLSC